ncbi:MAG TPA: FtsX-like permease family protein [Nitrospirota bacterium]|nr:FtsX-like permease family protein [Nitrospirota bacterium]
MALKKTEKLFKHLAIFNVAVDNVIRHKLRSLTVILCLVAILSPFLSAISILEGVKAQSVRSVEEGADIYVTMDLYGRNGIIPINFTEAIKGIAGVSEAVPRVVGRVFINGKPAVLLGISLERRTDDLMVVQGDLPQSGEVAVGKKLARALNLDVGSDVSIGMRAVGIINDAPYTLTRVYRVSGLIDAAADIRAADIVLMNVNDVADVYEIEGFVTDIAVYTKSGSEAQVINSLIRMNSSFRIQTKALAKTYVEGGLNMRGGIFTALYLVAFAVAVPAILVSTGIGFVERRKEIGVLKATGWGTSEVMEVALYENTLYALTGASAALIISFIWVRILNGFLIAKLFIPGIGGLPSFPVPSRFLPLPFFAALCIAIAVTMTGSLITTWRTAVVPPAETLR